MDQASHNRIVSFIWGIADDVLRDLFKRGKYPDVILPMCVLRRMDAVLEPTKKVVLGTKAMLDQAGITEQHAALCKATDQAFYNTSKFSLRDLKSRGNQQQLKADFDNYLEGFSDNVQDIIEDFKFRNHVPTLSKADALGALIEKFLDPEINLSPNPVLNGDGSVKHPAMDNHSMGTVFEELVRLFNEENNEEAGEHWTPRDAVRLMTTLMFKPIAARVKAGSYLLYDCACGTGGHAHGGRGVREGARCRSGSRRPTRVGWATSSTNDRALALAALSSALRLRRPPPGLVHHSDRGSPYASDDYRAALRARGIVASMSRKGDCYDNAVAESFFATARAELLDHERFETRAAAVASLTEYIDGFYNSVRRHSYIDYVSPIEFELKRLTRREAA